MRFFRSRSDGFEKETRQVLDLLQCESIVFNQNSSMDEVREIYINTYKLGKYEDMIPVFILPFKKELYRQEERRQMVLSVKSEPRQLLRSQENCGKLNCEIVLAKIPAKYPWEIYQSFTRLSQNLYIKLGKIVEVSKAWYEVYGAVPAVVSVDSIDFLKERNFLPTQRCFLDTEGLL